MHSKPRVLGSRLHRDRGFTLVEIMIVVVIIGLLAGLAIPAMNKVRITSQNTRFVNDLRVATNAIETYAMENGEFPPDGAAAMHPDLNEVLPPATWSLPTVLGGEWDWDFQQFGFKAGLSVFQPTAPVEQFEMIDQMIDDGNLATGTFRARSQGYIYILEE
jgi:prepilin-type N-terminal cleavage/methylation domain-containing protein